MSILDIFRGPYQLTRRVITGPNYLTDQFDKGEYGPVTAIKINYSQILLRRYYLFLWVSDRETLVWDFEVDVITEDGNISKEKFSLYRNDLPFLVFMQKVKLIAIKRTLVKIGKKLSS